MEKNKIKESIENFWLVVGLYMLITYFMIVTKTYNLVFKILVYSYILLTILIIGISYKLWKNGKK